MFTDIPVPSKIEVFSKLPTPSAEVFNAGIPLDNAAESLSSIILYQPDLENIGCLDNAASAASSTYSLSVTSGFTFTSTQSIGAEFLAEVNVIVAKSSLKLTMNLQFSEQWNESKTETISCTVGGGKIAYLYRGTLCSRFLTYNPKERSYTYGKAGRFSSNNVLTSDTPITGKASLLSFESIPYIYRLT